MEKKSRQTVSTTGAPKAIGPYSQGIVAGDWSGVPREFDPGRF